MPYTMDKHVVGDFDEVVEQTTAALEEEGFGILCDIDVQQTFEKKLDMEFRKYRILGACNPSLAYDALEEEERLGALLPCNVIVYESTDGDLGVSAVDPDAMLSVAENPALDPIATDVRKRFERVLATLPEA